MYATFSLLNAIHLPLNLVLCKFKRKLFSDWCKKWLTTSLKRILNTPETLQAKVPNTFHYNANRFFIINRRFLRFVNQRKNATI